MTSNVRDHKGRPIAVVTGMGMVTSLGWGKADNWLAVTEGRSGVKRIRRFATEGMRTTIAAEVDVADGQDYVVCDHCNALAVSAIEEALDQSGIGSKGSFPGTLVLAVPPFEIDWTMRFNLSARAGDKLVNGQQSIYPALYKAAAEDDWTRMYESVMRANVAERLAERFGTRGQPVSLSTACASGATAIQIGVEAVRRGDTDAALCVGTEATVNPESLIRFTLLSAMSTENDPPEAAAKPFSKDRDGFVMGEGAGALVIESLESAQARGARILGVVRGCGERADNFHRTRSNPDGAAIIGALRNALDDAAADPSEIDYVNPHGTGTPENDKMEYLALSAIFGDRVAEVPVSSNKSMIGHTLSAAGTVEAIFSLLTIENGTMPPTINYRVPDPELPLDVVPNTKRDKAVSTVMSNSFGFGGQNVSLVLSAEPA